MDVDSILQLQLAHKIFGNDLTLDTIEKQTELIRADIQNLPCTDALFACIGYVSDLVVFLGVNDRTNGP